MKENEYQTSKKERLAYAVYFFGQNVLWGFAGLVSTYLLDIGIDAATASAILLVPKIWDAVNDTLFGFIVDKTRFRNREKFLPWIRIGTALFAPTVILLFAIPRSINSQIVKIAWFIIAYVIFDAAYTMLDAPVYALPTAMTTNISERTKLISSNRFSGIFGAALASIIIPIVRPKTGWFAGAIVFGIFATVFMLPVLFMCRERNTESEANEREYTFSEMIKYLTTNRYLRITLLLIFIIGVCSVESVLSLIMARNCLGDESKSSIVTMISGLPVLVVSLLIPMLNRRFDKRTLLICGLACGFFGCAACYLAGYQNLPVFIALSVFRGIGSSFFMVLSYMMIADSVEYGTYKSGVRATGISFALQTFTSKLKAAVIASVALFLLGLFGYDSSLAETAIQSQSVIDGIWTVYNILPAIGNGISLLIMIFLYKLRDQDVEIMARCNSGEIQRREAEELLQGRY